MSPSASAYPARRGSFLAAFLVWLLLPVLLAAGALAWFEWSYVGRIYPGVQALGVNLGGMTPERATAALTEAVGQYAPPPISLRYGDEVWELPAEEVGLRPDVNRLVRQAYLVGRTARLEENLRTQWATLWQGRRIEPELAAPPGSIANAIAARTAQLNRPATEAQLSLDNLQVVVSGAEAGRRVDLEATTAAVLDRLASGRGGVVDVSVHQVAAAGADLGDDQSALQDMLNRTIVLADPRGDFQFALDPATMAGMLTWVRDENAVGGLRPVLKTEAARVVVEAWAQQVARPPLNARFDFDPKRNQLIELSPSSDGYALEVDATVAAIARAVSSGQTQVALPIQIVRPAIASEDAPNLGITELVAEGSTNFAGSSADRVQNIEVGAAKFVGVVIPPDGVFSFNEHVGDVTAANGFQDALVIQGDTTAVGIGGGICQVSTTVFRAAWYGGFPILERWNHGYVVRWYGAPGLDATIYTPKVDFKFKNTTGHHLLIKPIVDTVKGIITFQFYGTRPDWRVETTDPVYAKRTPPPAPLYVEDPGLASGRVVQFDWAVEGLEASASRRVLAADGTVLLNDTLKSRYLPWQAKFRFGPGFEPPAGAEVERAG
ncbi:MAG: VanW family protein [Caldilineales bacterium]|nr:VanW family protein [Caldilineales bacterium]MCW5857207.1 VanW family protein [Caldilineales bacterium]